MSEDDRRVVAEALDPAGYVAHVTRTAMLLEQLARDVAAVRAKVEDASREMGDLRKVSGETKQEVAVFKVDTGARISANQEAIKELSDGLRWVRRLVVGAVLAGIASGLIALVFKALEK